VQHAVGPLVHHPGRQKMGRNLAVSQIIIEALESLDMKYPTLDYDPRKIVVK